MTKDTIIEKIPLVKQAEASDDFWKVRSCGMATLKMILVFKNSELMKLSLDEFISRGIEAGAYIKDVGWGHSGLVNLAKSYGIFLNFQKEFFKTSEEKNKGLRIINKELRAGRPVAVSVLPGFNGQKDNHILLIAGIRLNGHFIAGYHIQDPYAGIRGHNYFVSKEEFISGWRGGMIYLAN